MPKKSSLSSERQELTQQIDWALRELSTSTVLVASSIAQKVGMGPNDLKCAELLVRNGPMTAGQLAKATGLTSGAITGIVDRLEKAGWARREADPHDRRRIIIHPGPQENQKSAADLYASHEKRMDLLFSDYTDEQLFFILQFIRRLTSTNYEEAGRRREA
ncbi:MAG: MarR family transcriptional regulator [Chloroflexi bacterium]|nr:MarR family transcriptional regulator [Chloroflexota bacterium]MCI0576545.1 MarR family transcriptional regulator [Chloroflexota bacterium]MCI0646676.1 MarR family transcriptional regulator [Chloroflexota bacterium]MCI0727537.1 MarR family transcriptional regulator [Chloroflexota bacterium]